MNLLLQRCASLMLSRSLHLADGEHLLVLHDGTIDPVLVDAFATAGAALGAEPVVASYRPTRFVAMQVFGLFAAASLEEDPERLPAPALAALGAADAAVILNSDLELLFDPRFLRAAREGPRIGWVPYLDPATVLRLLPQTPDDLDLLHTTTTRVGEALAAATDVRVTSEAGTDLRLRIGSHRLNWSSGVQEKGRGYGGLEIWPSGQISTVPDAGSADGTLVIDRSVNVPEYKEVLDPIALTVSGGRVTGVDGGVEARRLADFLAALDHPDVFHLTELGVGTNTRCVAAGRAGPAEDTHSPGCVSFALGADVHLGGEVRAPIHLDMTMRRPTLTLDGTPVVEEGRLVG